MGVTGAREEPPTTSPLLLMAPATLSAPPKVPRSVI